MGMTKTGTATLTATQFRTATIVLGLAALTAGGEVDEFDARTAGARVDSLAALVRKGVLVVEYRQSSRPEVLGGAECRTAFYSAK